MSKLTIAKVRAALALNGATIRKADGEYCVRVKGSPVGHGSFTNDLTDALHTGIDMARRSRQGTLRPIADAEEYYLPSQCAFEWAVSFRPCAF